jgi:hypothetical protein
MKQVAKIFDLCALVGSFVVATIILYSSSNDMTLAEFMAIRIKLGNCLLFAGLLGTLQSLFVFCGLYVSKRLTTRRVEILEVCKATLLASGLLLFLATVFHFWMVKPGFVLTSMVKRVDNAVYDVVKEVLDGKFEGGFHAFGLDKDGVAYAMDDNNKALIPPDVIDKVEASKQKIINGEIKVTDAMAK